MNIRIGTYTELSDAFAELRRKVFIDEQGVPKGEVFDELDFEAVHIVLYDNDAPVATARIIKENDSWRIGLVAVDESKRGQHLGVKVMQSAIEYVNANGGKVISLTAQQQVSGFYQKLGFAQCGEAEVFESGFVLIPMKLDLTYDMGCNNHAPPRVNE